MRSLRSLSFLRPAKIILVPCEEWEGGKAKRGKGGKGQAADKKERECEREVFDGEAVRFILT